MKRTLLAAIIFANLILISLPIKALARTAVFCPLFYTCSKQNDFSSCVPYLGDPQYWTFRPYPSGNLWQEKYWFHSSQSLINGMKGAATCAYKSGGTIGSMEIINSVNGIYADNSYPNKHWNGTAEDEICISNNSYDCPFFKN